jgi:polygalacturonase
VSFSSRREFLGAAAAAPVLIQGRNAVDSGAVGDGKTLNTTAIQNAIDGCAQAGGGAVVFPPGVYLTGSIEIRSGVRLHLAAGAVIRGSTSLEDYPRHTAAFRSYTDNYTDRCLIRAEKASDIGIDGQGIIDGQGSAFSGPYKVRPYLLRFVECKGVSVQGVRFENSPMWVQHYLACDDVLVSGVTVRSRVNHNNDGIDIDSCQNVRIANCDISSGDDAICLKSTSDRVCRDVVIEGCTASSACNAIKLGTESNGGFQNINISNCALYDTRLAGIALEMVDGGVLDNVAVSGITMRDVKGPVFMRLGDRGRPFRKGGPKPKAGSFGNVILQGVQATGASRTGCSITGVPGAPVRRVSLHNVSIQFEGGGTAEDAAREIEELPANYPEYQMFKTLPSYGFFCRHVEDLSFSGVRLSYAAPERRPALVFDDIAGLRLRDVEAQAAAELPAAAVLRGVRGALIRDCRVSGGAAFFHREAAPR